MNNVVNKNSLNASLLKRVEAIDDNFVGYVGEKYIYIIGLSLSEVNKEIITHFEVLNKIDENTFIKVPTPTNSFVFETQQKDDSVFKDVNYEPILIYENGIAQTETVTVDGVEEQRPVMRTNEYTRNITAFASILAPAIEVTCKRFFGEKI